MIGKDEKARRKNLRHALRDQERRAALERFPVPILILKELFDFLDVRLSESQCDHTLRLTREFVRRNSLDEERMMQWLEQHGGFCDCEALNNAEPIVADAVSGYDRIPGETGSVN